MFNIEKTVYLIEIQLIFDVDRIIKFFLDPTHPTVKMLFNLWKTEGKIAFHFYNNKTNIIACSCTELNDAEMEWLIRNIKLIRRLKSNPYYFI